MPARKDKYRENNRIQIDLQMAAPNYPRNGNQRSRPNHRKQTKLMAATICASGQCRFHELILIKLIKWTVKLVLK